jgi:hypothetical protein
MTYKYLHGVCCGRKAGSQAGCTGQCAARPGLNYLIE